MKIGFIGCGNMGEAMLKGIISSKIVELKKIYLHTKNPLHTKSLVEKYQVNGESSNESVVKNADIIILATKPDMYPIVINEILSTLNKDKVLVSITPSFTLDELLNMVDNRSYVVRSIPNTPAMVNKGMTGLSYTKDLPVHLVSDVLNIFNSFGEVIVVDESKLSILSTLSGSAPAFIFLFMKSFIEYGFQNGFTMEELKVLVGQTFKGSTSLFQASNLSIDQLITQVCSKGGSTIEGIYHLNQNEFKHLVQEALQKTTNRFIEMTLNKLN